jgi:hypothetical protein
MRTIVPLRWLAGQDPLHPSAALTIWRGQTDRWTFADGQLGRAVVRIGGYPGDAWDSSGILAWLEADIRALERGEDVDLARGSAQGMEAAGHTAGSAAVDP